MLVAKAFHLLKTQSDPLRVILFGKYILYHQHYHYNYSFTEMYVQVGAL